MVSRLRGEAPELADALPPPERFRWDTSWLKFSGANLGQASVAEGQWFVEGKGNREQRGYFFALLQDTAEILWTNGTEVKLGLQPWAEFQRARASGDLRPLPRLTPFGQVLNETVTVLPASVRSSADYARTPLKKPGIRLMPCGESVSRRI
ncbi:hypothetical protein QQF73_09070 [Marinobacter sp. M216]|uniref:Uncharacterized protein n=1 Tax=Marinobacter albus TaxID=3030833 RepID=A0ABT7HCL7_9GAMM|nr:hypothetical protein [Marinobacter sp. M216]MDK9557772.1 hypothetical protein [Marinobacter sp. M216]